MKTTDNQKELFYWVDENDQELGAITRREAHNGSFKIHRGVWVMVFNKRGELFLHKRSSTKDSDPGKWSLSVGGHVTYGQTYEVAAKREFTEELGVAAPQLEFLEKYLFIGKSMTEISCVYRVNHEGLFSLNTVEIERGQFFSLLELEDKVRRGELVLANWPLAIIQAQCHILPERPERKKNIIKVF